MKFAQALAPLAFAAVALAVPTSLEARQSGWCASSAKALAYGIVTETWVYDLVRIPSRVHHPFHRLSLSLSPPGILVREPQAHG